MTDLPSCSQKYFNDIAADMATTNTANCYLRQALLSGKIDTSMIATLDCTTKYCTLFINNLYIKSKRADYCSFIEAQTGNLYTFQTLNKFCDGTTTPGATTIPSTSLNTTAPKASSNAPQTGIPTSDSGNGISNNQSKSWIDDNKFIIIGVSVCVFAVIVGIIVFMCRRRQKEKIPHVSMEYTQMNETSRQQDVQSNKLPLNSTHSSKSSTRNSQHLPPFPSVIRQADTIDMCGLEMQRIATTDVRMIQPLAQGAFGEVWLGEYLGNKIAIKRLLKTQSVSLAELQKFIFEISLNSKIKCPFIVEFIGVMWTKPADIMLLTEFMDGGDLRSVLQNNANRTFTWSDKLRCAQAIAEGLVYLHSMDPQIIHRDLKSRNVLLDSAANTKITDFGIARENNDSTMTAGIGTYRWMAPEVLIDGHYTESADIFSFGVILSELDSEILPYSDLRNAMGNPYTDTAIMAKVINGGLSPSFTSACPVWYVDLGRLCMSLNPSERPSATKLSYILRKQMQDKSR